MSAYLLARHTEITVFIQISKNEATEIFPFFIEVRQTELPHEVVNEIGLTGQEVFKGWPVLAVPSGPVGGDIQIIQVTLPIEIILSFSFALDL